MTRIVKGYQRFSRLGSTSLSGFADHVPTPEPAPELEKVELFDWHPHNLPSFSWRKQTTALVAALLVVSVGALFITAGHGSFAKIMVAGQPVKANESSSKIEQKVAQAAAQYKLGVRYVNGVTKQYSLKTVGVSVDAHQTAVQAKQSINHSFVQRFMWWRPIELSAVTHSSSQLDKFIQSDVTIIKTAPVDAGLSVDGANITVSPDKVGSGSQVPNATQVIPVAISQLDKQPLQLKSSVLEPSITAREATASKAKADAIIKESVKFSIDGNEITAAPSDVASWLDISPAPKHKAIDVTVDSGKVLQFINDSAKQFINLPRSRLVVNTDDGEVVLDQGASGVDVVNKDKTATDIATSLTKGKSVDLKLDVAYSEAKTVTASPYDKWFIADVTSKRMYAYEGTKLVRSFLISAGAPATPTVLGSYQVYSKYESQDMTGANADGSRYEQPDVPYVNYFYSDYAIHGNYWRPESYFGNINSSHGCIGVDVTDAAWIYDWASIGTHVIVHA